MIEIERLDAWRAAFRALDQNANPKDVLLHDWRQFLRDCSGFLADKDGACWAEEAVALGWDEYQLFAADRVKPWARLDQMGVLWLVRGYRVVAILPEVIYIRPFGRDRAEMAYRAKRFERRQVALPWELANG